MENKSEWGVGEEKELVQEHVMDLVPPNVMDFCIS